MTNKTTTYEEFLQTKIKTIQESGFDVDESELNHLLFDFQKYIVKRSLKAGRFAIFADCGLGKTFMQLEWARLVAEKTNQPVLILCPLAVAGQTIKEGERFGIHVERLKSDVFGQGIYITNYEQLENIDCSVFSGVVLDESQWEPVTNITKKNFPLDTWQKWASPVWMDIKRTDVLNGPEGTAMGDEKHIAPLQLEVINRIVNLWSNEGEMVFTPFLGIGSEAYMAVKNNRKAIGCELKDSYFDVAVKNIQKAESVKAQCELFL